MYIGGRMRYGSGKKVLHFHKDQNQGVDPCFFNILTIALINESWWQKRGVCYNYQFLLMCMLFEHLPLVHYFSVS